MSAAPVLSGNLTPVTAPKEYPDIVISVSGKA